MSGMEGGARAAKGSQGVGLAGYVVLGVLALVGLAFTLAPALIGAAVYLAALRRLRWSENLLLFGAAVTALLLGGTDLWAGYATWVLSFGPGTDIQWLPPWGPVLLTGLAAGALAGLVSSTAVGSRVTRKVVTRIPLPFSDPLAEEELVPSEQDRQRATAISPPGGLMPTVPHPSGERTAAGADPAASSPPPDDAEVPIGYDGRGKVVSVTLKEFSTHGMILGSTGSGKALAVDTPIPTPDGPVPMGDLRTGDTVFDEQGRQVTVTAATEPWRAATCFTVTFDDGQRIIADGPHRWATTSADGAAVRTTAELAGSVERCHDIAVSGPWDYGQPGRSDDPLTVGATVAAGGPLPAGQLDAPVEVRRRTLVAVLAACGVVDGHDGEVTVHTAPQRNLRRLAESVGGVAVDVADSDRLALRLPAAAVAVDVAFQAALADRFGPAAATAVASLPAALPAALSRRIVSVQPCAPTVVRCITVDGPSHLYLAAGGIATHNTETIKSVSGGMLDLGVSGIILDLKEDTAEGGLRDFYQTYAAEHGLPFQQLALSDPDPPLWFNPLAGMGADEARDTILAQQRFDDEHWQHINKRMLGQASLLLYAAHRLDPDTFEQPSMYLYGRLLSAVSIKKAFAERASAVVKAYPDQFDVDSFSSLLAPSPDEEKAARGYGAKLTSLYETQVGQRVLRPGPGREQMDVTADGITYIGLDTLGKTDITRAVSTAVIQRMNVDASQRTTGLGGVSGKKQRFFFVDEANWVARQPTMNLLARARSAGIMVVLCTQGPTDWIDQEGDYWAAMTQNINVALIMSQGAPQAAELAAEFIGSDEKLSSSMKYENWRMVNEGQVRKDVDFVVPPHVLRELTVGELVLRVGKPTGRVSWARVPMRDPAAHAPTSGRGAGRLFSRP